MRLRSVLAHAARRGERDSATASRCLGVHGSRSQPPAEELSWAGDRVYAVAADRFAARSVRDVVELIAHHELPEETPGLRPFSADEFLGVCELGLVGPDPPKMAIATRDARDLTLGRDAGSTGTARFHGRSPRRAYPCPPSGGGGCLPVDPQKPTLSRCAYWVSATPGITTPDVPHRISTELRIAKGPTVAPGNR